MCVASLDLSAVFVNTPGKNMLGITSEEQIKERLS